LPQRIVPKKAICVYNGSQTSVADVFHEAIGAILEGIFGPMLSTPRNIYTWLTQLVLDPTNSGRVTMDYLMKGIPTALEWSFEAKAPNVRAETLEKAAELLVLRRDTLRIIDGAGPVSDATQSDSTGQDQASETEGDGVSERDCACMRTLKQQGGVLRFKSHDKRKTRTPNTDQRWARRKTSWEVVGGEST
jgi:hypothetical protein